MKILLTGGGTGGHFYPLIAVAEQINKLVIERKLVDVGLYYMAPTPYNERALFENRITFIRVPAGKLRTYFSLKTIIDLFSAIIGVIRAIFSVFFLFPDIVFSKGGYASFPVLFAARIFRIPVFIHESDTIPGRVNLWAGKFARRIAVSYAQAARSFPVERTAFTGNPIRDIVTRKTTTGAREFLNLAEEIPVLLILGGSQGSARINETIIDALPDLIKSYQIIHQTGRDNFEAVRGRSGVVLEGNSNASRYRIYPYLNDSALSMSAGVASLVISRAGSTIFEIATWGLPSIIIPIPKSVSRDQEENAFAYTKTGAAVLIKEENLTPHILISEVNRILNNPQLSNSMKEKALSWNRHDAARTIAEEIVALALTHEK